MIAADLDGGPATSRGRLVGAAQGTITINKPQATADGTVATDTGTGR